MCVPRRECFGSGHRIFYVLMCSASSSLTYSVFLRLIDFSVTPDLLILFRGKSHTLLASVIQMVFVTAC
ncbi:hypothetical protein Y032_0042g632 [Ancylostoma ceylanicum]|uniref:Uncharacterized protein n=1 Tax=Ancylostoma ceylanicum TaxID=53326 RepID=A0A016UGD4_9BILA|nr:hypothetical protein Y032_0042g632 [Ancylostoma ceylanicum]